MGVGLMAEHILRVIGQSELFAGLDPLLLRKIADVAQRTSLSAGEILFQQGDPADAVWGVLSGRITQTMRNEDGREMTVDVIEPGQVFAEVAVLDWGPRRFEAVAAEDSSLFRISRRQFLELLQTSPELCFRVFALLCSHLRGTSNALEEAALQKFPARLAKRLTALAADNGAEQATNAGATVLRISQGELARLIGVNREAVNRHLRSWQKQGWLTLKRRQIEINDMAALASLAAPADSSNGIAGKRLTFKVPDGLLERRGDTSESVSPMHAPTIRDMRNVGLMAVVVSDYSRAMMADAAGTLKSLSTGIATIENAVSNSGGAVIGQAGDSIIARFPDALAALRAAKSIQKKIAPRSATASAAKMQALALFRLGVHAGDIVVDGDRYVGPAISIALRVAQYAEPGDVYLSGVVREQVKAASRIEFRFLGKQRFRNIEQSVPIYSAQPVPVSRWIWTRVDSLLSRRLRPVAAVGAAMALMAVIWVAAQQYQQDALAMVPTQSIAVLPFDNLSAAPEDAFLADGLSEELTRELMGLEGLKVTGRNSVQYYKGRDDDIGTIGKMLQVAYVLEGSVRKLGDNIRVTAQLTQVANGFRAWSGTYDSDADSIFAVQRKIAGNVAQVLEMRFDAPGQSNRTLPLTTDAEAYMLFLQARYLNGSPMQVDALKALPLLDRAIELDPEFAEAHALLAIIYHSLAPADKSLPFDLQERSKRSNAAVARALSLKPNSPKVLAAASRIMARDGDHEGARQMAERAVAADSNDPDALWALRIVRSTADDWAAALEILERLIRLEPISTRVLMSYAFRLFQAGRLDEARVMAERARTLSANPRPASSLLAAIALARGDAAQAIDLSVQGRPYGNYLDLWFGLQDVDLDSIKPRIRAAGPYAYLGEYDKVRQIVLESFANSFDSPEYLIARGELEVLTGNYEQAIEFFDRARPKLPYGDTELFWSKSYSAYLSWSRKSSPSLALLYAYRQTGQHDMADEMAALIEREIAARRQKFDSVGGTGDHQLLYREAELLAIEGRVDAAIAALRRWQSFDPQQFNYLKSDPFLIGLHDEAEFWQIVAEVETGLAKIRQQVKAASPSLKIETAPES